MSNIINKIDKVLRESKQIKIKDEKSIPIEITNQFPWLAKAKFKNATISIKNSVLIWHDGVWIDGTWEYGIWKNGTWWNGVLNRAIWWNGTWKDGTWKNGRWEDGTWVDGEWKNGTLVEWYMERWYLEER